MIKKILRLLDELCNKLKSYRCEHDWETKWFEKGAYNPDCWYECKKCGKLHIHTVNYDI